MNYIEEKVEEFERLARSVKKRIEQQATPNEIGADSALVKLVACYESDIREVDRRARESEREKMREEEDTYNENTLNA